MSTLTVSIDRTSLGLSALVFSGADDGTLWGIVGDSFQSPSKHARVTYASDSPWVHGSVATGWSWQQGLLSFDATPAVSSEADLKAAVAEVETALARLAYEATSTPNGVPDVWRCDPGSIVLSGGRSFVDLRDFDPVYTVTIPCYPVSS